jgi:protein associated with RNAse G/E
VLYAYLTEIFMVWYSGKAYKAEGQYIIAAVTRELLVGRDDHGPVQRRDPQLLWFKKHTA